MNGETSEPKLRNEEWDMITACWSQEPESRLNAQAVRKKISDLVVESEQGAPNTARFQLTPSEPGGKGKSPGIFKSLGFSKKHTKD